MRLKYLDMYEAVHNDMIYTNRFDESSDLITTYLGKMTAARETEIKVEEKFPVSEQGYTLGKMSISVRYWCKQVQHVKIILCEVPNSTCIAQICFKHTGNTGQKWSICGCTVCNTSDNRCSWPQF